MIDDRKRFLEGLAVPLLLALGVAGAGVLWSCTHTSFETCVRDAAVKLAEVKVQAAVSCKGDKACIEDQLISDVGEFAVAAAECKVSDVDGGK